MNREPQPSPNSQNAGLTEFNILVRLQISVDPAEAPALCYPSFNRIGTIVLSALLQASFRADGVSLQRCTAGLELNRAIVFIRCENVGAGLETTRRALASAGLAGCAQLAWIDTREDVWRLWWPTAGGVLAMPTLAELNAEVDRQAAVTRWLLGNQTKEGCEV